MNLRSINSYPHAMRFFCASLFIFSLVQTVAHAMVINITFDSSITGLGNAAQVESAINTAAQTFEALYTNNITVNITASFSPSVGLGESQSFETGNPAYSDVTSYLAATSTTAEASNSVASLPASDPTGGGGLWWLPTAEARTFAAALNTTVLGVVANDNSQDGNVLFASTVTYTYDPINRVAAGKYDLIGVVEHEISEVLGRRYGLNIVVNGQANGFIPYDLFRFNSGTRSFDTNAASPYFSIDNGVTALKYFNPNASAGDLQDWKIYSPADSFDYAISSDQKGYLTYADLIALNVLGYELSFQPPNLSAQRLSNGTMQLNFTNVTGLNFSILASTNIATPLANWTVLGTPTETSVGNYQFVDSSANKTRFYRARLN